MWIYLVFLAAIGLLRIVELRVSRRNWQHHQGKAAKLEEPLFRWMVLLHSSFFVLIPLELWLRQPSFGGPLSWVACSLVALTLLLRTWTLRTMGRSWNVEVVHGPDYPIITHGPYRYIRHPNYLVVILELVFIPLIYHLYASAALLTLANAMVLRVRIRNEEAVLFQNPNWVEKMSGKPRFVPGLPAPSLSPRR